MTVPEKKAVKDFVHDINNVLNAISMQTELALLHADSGNLPEIEKALTAIQAECRRAARTSQDAYDELVAG